VQACGKEGQTTPAVFDRAQKPLKLKRCCNPFSCSAGHSLVNLGSSLFSVEYGAQRSTKFQAQAPNTKLQRSSKSQAPDQGPSDVMATHGGTLKFGPWNFSGAWSLGFGASRWSDSIEKQRRTLICLGGATRPDSACRWHFHPYQTPTIQGFTASSRMRPGNA
jgi:hypothetical protein